MHIHLILAPALYRRVSFRPVISFLQSSRLGCISHCIADEIAYRLKQTYVPVEHHCPFLRYRGEWFEAEVQRNASFFGERFDSQTAN